MLRTALLVLAIGAPSIAAAEEFPQSSLHLEVRSDAGTVMSRVESVERDGDGRVISVEAPGLEPADAPADADMIAQNGRAEHFFASYPTAERNDHDVRVASANIRVR